MSEVVFLDSSVLLNLLDVPGKNSDHSSVLAEFRTLLKGGALLVIPVAAVVEVGNHIAQLPSGDQRRRYGSTFSQFLEKSVAGTPPWVVSGGRWDADFLDRLLRGDTRRPGLVELATQAVGSGDASILLELAHYRARTDLPSGLPVRLWTFDETLGAWQ